MGKVNNLLNNAEQKCSAYYTPFGIIVYGKNGTRLGEVSCEEDICLLTGDDDWWFGDGSTIGTT